MDQTDRPDFKKLKYTPHHLGAEEVEVARGRLGRQQAGMVGLGVRREEARVAGTGQGQGWEQAQRKEQRPLPLCALSSCCQLDPLGGCGWSFSRSASWASAPFLLPSEPFRERKFIEGRKCFSKLRDPPPQRGWALSPATRWMREER